MGKIFALLIDVRMADWLDLKAELDQWGDAGLQAEFWWRDDDGARVTAQLERLLALSELMAVPVALSVVPSRATRELRTVFKLPRLLFVLQHGIEHKNRGDSAEPEIELGGSLPRQSMLIGLAAGKARLDALYGRRALPVLVPPWNRAAPGLIPLLPQMGFKGISTWAPRKYAEAVDGVRQANVHVDLAGPSGAANFAGEARVLEGLATHLRLRRTRDADPSEPTGLLSHHASQNERCWNFLAELLEWTRNHPAAHWKSPEEVFNAAPS